MLSVKTYSSGYFDEVRGGGGCEAGVVAQRATEASDSSKDLWRGLVKKMNNKDRMLYNAIWALILH